MIAQLSHADYVMSLFAGVGKLQDANVEYRKRMHNICCDNCHSHVAFALNGMGYRGKYNWNMFILGWEAFFFGES